eukprot:gnl/TRDRNA2_/TRDRNA2_188370_c0_seq1.p1 gnl/TRDRNA2_/TRDRNA2_188370_c0~~gnl/TRDRNA2_/TRDRNA2_188370_c0_seq1.p1  ORF type:complete len:342 (+),score=37.92 gnl/TRDRNA2_/TRDRNA2_188370_c0_seq1:122-1147(+)
MLNFVVTKPIVVLCVCLTFTGAALADGGATTAKHRTVRIKDNVGLHTERVIEDLSLVDMRSASKSDVCGDGSTGGLQSAVGCSMSSKLPDQLLLEEEVPMILPDVLVSTPTECAKPPSPVAHAKLFYSEYYGKKVPCSNAVEVGLDSYHSHCNVECETGYKLVKNDLACIQRGDPLSFPWGQVMGQAICVPMNCGSPPALSHALSSHHEVTYPDTFAYTCQPGYSLDQAANGPKKQNIQCLANGNFSQTTSCKRVLCGSCPVHPNTKAGDGRFARAYGDLCNYECADGFSLDRSAAGHKEYTVQCMASGHFSAPETCQPVIVRSDQHDHPRIRGARSHSSK